MQCYNVHSFAETGFNVYSYFNSVDIFCYVSLKHFGQQLLSYMCSINKLT